MSGVILFDETLRQATSDERPVPRLPLRPRRAARHQGRHRGQATGRPSRRDRDRGARRPARAGRRVRRASAPASPSGGPCSPSATSARRRACVAANAHALARYAALCQEGGLVPIVEPEVLIEGDHSIETCEAVTDRRPAGRLRRSWPTRALTSRPSCSSPAWSCPARAPGRRRRWPMWPGPPCACLRAAVPAAVPGIAFLSGGQSPEVATAHLDAMNRLGPQPWQLTFSYGRALQDPALAAYALDGGRHDRGRPGGAAPPGPVQQRRPGRQLDDGDGDPRPRRGGALIAAEPLQGRRQLHVDAGAGAGPGGDLETGTDQLGALAHPDQPVGRRRRCGCGRPRRAGSRGRRPPLRGARCRSASTAGASPVPPRRASSRSGAPPGRCGRAPPPRGAAAGRGRSPPPPRGRPRCGPGSRGWGPGRGRRAPTGAARRWPGGPRRGRRW